MRVKKQIALLLSGAILAGSLAGCSRTIIEHQFHTNTVTNTEYIEKITEGDTLLILQGLNDYLKSKGIGLNVGWTFNCRDVRGSETIGDDVIDDNELNNFIESGTLEIYKKFNSGMETELSGYISTAVEAVNTIYEALKKINDWDAFIAEHWEDDESPVIIMEAYQVADDNTLEDDEYTDYYLYMSLYCD